MKPKTPLKDRKFLRRQRAIALVIVLAMVSMMTIFMLAIFSVSRTEHTSSVKYADGQNAKELADVAVNVVMAQIWDGTQRTAANPSIWASQPGAIRRYNLDGSFHSGYKLYSSPLMQVNSGEAQMIADAAPAEWASLKARFTDLNDPVIRPNRNGSGAPEVIFPIIDPRAYVPGAATTQGNSNVEGFWYNQSYNGVIPATSVVDLNARLPMPVEWVYVLKNGMLGTLSDSGDILTFVPATSSAANQATEDNPIVGRIAFWTDDETCKININTAGEPTPWTPPQFCHERDLEFAHFQPMSHEYQRYPGHPATIAMSSVLFPNQDMDLYGKSPLSTQYQTILRRKERIYEVMPKLNFGGSRAGTLAYWIATDTNQRNITSMMSVQLGTSIRERLYASVDELMFSQSPAPNGKSRLLQDQNLRSSADSPGVPFFNDPADLERARFFLTAHSRMPEINMYGMPRVAIWPIADESRGPNDASDFRTGYDKLIAFCSSLGTNATARRNNSYFFRRLDYSSATTDVNLPRNQQLLNMLANILENRVMPGGATFASKYSNGDARQILIEIFDYIRSTNLYDGFLAPTRVDMLGDGTQGGGLPQYRWETYARNGPNEHHPDGTFYRNKPKNYRTYTPDRVSRWITGRGISGDTRNERTVEYSMPGHGSVVPSQWGDFRGMGRWPVISEIGFHLICSGDGNPDKGSFRMARQADDGTLTKPAWPGFPAARTAIAGNPMGAMDFVGGRTAVMMQAMPVGQLGVGPAAHRRANGQSPMFLPNERMFWYSNFPPFPAPGSYGTDPTRPADHPSHPRNHPGFQPRNWNACLEPNTALRPGEKRVQGQLYLEMCVPMNGYGPVHPEFTLVVTGLQGYRLGGENLFDPAMGGGRAVWKTGRELYHLRDDSGTTTTGGYIDGTSMAVDRRVKIYQRGIASDPNYDNTADNTAGDPHRGLRNYSFCSKYVTVSGESMEFSGSELRIEMYYGHVISPQNLLQTYTIPSIGNNVLLPVPQLVTISTDRRDMRNPVTGGRTVQREIHAPQWWALNFAGILGRYAGTWPGAVQQTSAVVNNGNPIVGATVGRFAGWSNDRLGLANLPRGLSFVFGYTQTSTNHSSMLLHPVNPSPDLPGTDDVTDTGFADMQSSETGNIRDPRGSDVMFSLVPAKGDPRHLMGMRNVPATEWVPHPKLPELRRTGANVQYFAHNISRANANANPGFDQGKINLRLVPNANYNTTRVPDVPAHIPTIAMAAMYGDWDNGPGLTRDGPWLNKPDEGNAGVAWVSQNGATRRIPTAYFQEEDRGADAGENYMTPNRMISSPGMFGSLPSRIKGGQPWRTLLFRPNTPRVASPVNHPGAAAHFGGVNPADHFIMDLFWMPVVEPYAISETFSSAGKVNLNYQIVPFMHIRRSTALHAALKGEIITAIPTADADIYQTYPGDGSIAAARRGIFAEVTREGAYHFRQPWSDFRESVYEGQRKHWHRFIEVEQLLGTMVAGTLQQFQSRFNFSASVTTTSPSMMGLFRTASQICEIHLLPKVVSGAPLLDGGDQNRVPYTPLDMINSSATGGGFWAQRQLTGDNTRERPYANIYGKITTQSNTFRVFYKAQTIRKARSVNPNQFDSTRDRVSSEYRGSTLIERKLDPNDPALPDYASTPSAAPLDQFYRFRVLENKRFAP